VAMLPEGSSAQLGCCGVFVSEDLLLDLEAATFTLEIFLLEIRALQVVEDRVHARELTVQPVVQLINVLIRCVVTEEALAILPVAPTVHLHLDGTSIFSSKSAQGDQKGDLARARSN